ncbi:hypothetical protein CEUSTIGMA_g878.t1 [Chlamydomonas eustigma]|uniref:LysM domain-containing protein n=1 Tax=Chlamydomonas eustigma TaxID=1157962 RepID=A0A250WRU4_9CHLO|nr:hypothetical protein CEUSTIGMA_g878.t1 [Chlamydomonas eustigma]|eukprot:GAX73426.1 hypothetical protein CEUSTIGMA_g878.t1 [Chlamydomonas eustigma]
MQSRSSRLQSSQAPRVSRVHRRSVVTCSFNVSVRPYTLRKGDTIESISKKREMTLEEVLAINPDINAKMPAADLEGKTIMLPANKLSVRDKEILEGIQKGKGKGYRIYPVRAGENLDDIMTKRGIERSEMEALNPGVNLEKLAGNQLIKLPSDKFTVREREMLAMVLPSEFFTAAKNPFVLGIGALLMVCGFVLAWQRFYADKDFNADE